MFGESQQHFKYENTIRTSQALAPVAEYLKALFKLLEVNDKIKPYK